MKLWAGRFSKEADQRTNDFNSSIKFDSRMYREDIDGSIAHAVMLGTQGIIPVEDCEKIINGLKQIKEDITSGELLIDPDAEDIHTFIEQTLTARIGDAGKRLHTGRSRNDQVATDIRLTLRKECEEVMDMLRHLTDTIFNKAHENENTIMPGYTHLQRAQPITFGHYLMAYASMVERDLSRYADARKRMNVSPIGSCALAGTTYDTDRHFEAAALGFDGVMENSLDGVSDRDFCLEFLSASSILMTHLSRLSEELCLYSSWEFAFIELSDAYTTGSSIMPQKKNPDMAELIRGKTGRVFGDTVAMLTILKGLPLAYNKDMQEDKERVFDTVDTVKACLSVLTPMLATMTVKADNMRRAAAGGFINATDLADYLVTKGMPFRSAYKIAGSLVADCIREKTTLEELPLEKYLAYSDLFDHGVYDAIDLDACVARRVSFGGTSPESVRAQVASMRARLGETK